MDKKRWPLIFLFIQFLIWLSSCSGIHLLRDTPTENGDSPAFVPLSAGVQEISGLVLSGDDQTPEGLLDTPRGYKYLVRLDSGEQISITYTAYPPSPAGQEQP